MSVPHLFAIVPGNTRPPRFRTFFSCLHLLSSILHMREFLADLHIHSRFSRATSKKLDIALLAAWARLKGISVVGTGDFTHPQWREELRARLRFDEQSGLYVLNDPASALSALPELPVENIGRSGLLSAKGARAAEEASQCLLPPVHFMLQGEISSIYKRGGKVRKVHNLVFMPDLDTAERFSLRLSQIGNLNADGRPILGLDSRDLLELVLEAHPQAFLVPAHIWTPWFSLFGSQSGFDRLEDCFADLSSEVFALETGLSSDPAMNRLWSALDRFRLISNSDAHSGENLGREANVFAGAISYQGMLQALKEPERARETRFRGTLEFFPEEGKYHMDGHRKCNVLLSPGQTRELGGICPVCGQRLTLGVLYRVMELADRNQPRYLSPGKEALDAATCTEPENSPNLGEGAFISLVPLPEILGEIFNVGPKSRKVRDMYAKLLERFGPELTVLRKTPEKELARYFPPLGEAVRRMRRGEVRLSGGYDGEYGVVRMFGDDERQELARETGSAANKKKSLAAERGLVLPGAALREHLELKKREREDDFSFSSAEDEPPAMPQNAPPIPENAESTDSGLNEAQERAVLTGPGPVLVLAGPGTGKTRTLIARIAQLLDQGINPKRILAVTFTRRAAAEMDERLAEALGRSGSLPRTDTLHALAFDLWHKTHTDVPVLLSEESARHVFAEANAEETPQTIRDAWQAINLARERLEAPPQNFAPLLQRYAAQKSAWNLADYTDLLEFWLERVSSGQYPPNWSHVLVDEVQDLSPLQLTLVRALLSPTGEGFFGIGDPDQSIYGFRGAHGDCSLFFASAWPGLQIIRLSHNYRSLGAILSVSHAALGEWASSPVLTPARRGKAHIVLFAAPSAEAESLWVAERVAALIGLGSHTLQDAVQNSTARKAAIPGQGEQAAEPHSPGDIAVLVRTHALAAIYRKSLAYIGVPVLEPVAEAFWEDERVRLILREAGRMLGIAVADSAQDAQTALPPCPDKVLVKGPLGFAAYLSAFPPFDALFWHSSAFRELVKAYDANGDWAGLFTWIGLQNELELARSKGEKVQILSIHAAKGLEFRSVFLPALEDGLLPFVGQDMFRGKMAEKKSPAFMREEQRLFYVALSRAKDALYLSHAGKRPLYGREIRLKPSRFLQLLPEGLIRRFTLAAHTIRTEKQLRLF